MDNSLGALFLVVASAISLMGFFAALRALFPGALRSSLETASLMPGRSLLVGFVNVIFLSALTLGLYLLGQGLGGGGLMLPGILLTAFDAVLISFGLTTMALMLGERLFPGRGAAGRAMYGGLLLILASAAPFVGWFGFLPYAVLTGVGAFILGMLGSKRAEDGDHGLDEA